MAYGETAKDKLVINPKTEKYVLKDGTPLTSPTRMLGPITYEKYKNIPRAVLDAAAEKGKADHEDRLPLIIEETWRHKDIPLESVDYEVLILNEEARYYGYVDAIVNGDTLIEFKTRATDDLDRLADQVQLYFYMLACEDINDALLIYYFRDTGQVQVMRLKRELIMVNNLVQEIADLLINLNNQLGHYSKILELQRQVKKEAKKDALH